MSYSSFLSSCFRNVQNSYKFYWFLAILEELEVKKGNSLSMHDLAVRMLAQVWYPLDYYKLSFGPWDRFKEISRFLSLQMKIDHTSHSLPLFGQISKQLPLEEQRVLYRKIHDLIRYVPYRFIRPFFEQELRGKADHGINKEIVRLANQEFLARKVMYRFSSDLSVLEIHPEWRTYLLVNLDLIRKSIYWELLNFLQRNNPNVIGLSEKLFKPVCRDLQKARRFWNTYRDIVGSLDCIYSGERLTGAISLDHFVPWSYIVHDQIWNIVPTTKSVNSTKGDQLPAVKYYLPQLIELHYNAFHAIYGSNLPTKEILLEDYCSLFKKDLREIESLSKAAFGKVYTKTLKPMLQFAANMGFGNGWRYKDKD